MRTKDLESSQLVAGALQKETAVLAIALATCKAQLAEKGEELLKARAEAKFDNVKLTTELENLRAQLAASGPKSCPAAALPASAVTEELEALRASYTALQTKTRLLEEANQLQLQEQLAARQQYEALEAKAGAQAVENRRQEADIVSLRNQLDCCQTEVRELNARLQSESTRTIELAEPPPVYVSENFAHTAATTTEEDSGAFLRLEETRFATPLRRASSPNLPSHKSYSGLCSESPSTHLGPQRINLFGALSAGASQATATPDRVGWFVGAATTPSKAGFGVGGSVSGIDFKLNVGQASTLPPRGNASATAVAGTTGVKFKSPAQGMQSPAGFFSATRILNASGSVSGNIGS